MYVSITNYNYRISHGNESINEYRISEGILMN